MRDLVPALLHMQEPGHVSRWGLIGGTTGLVAAGYLAVALGATPVAVEVAARDR